jgi:hypothetical protein
MDAAVAGVRRLAKPTNAPMIQMMAPTPETYGPGPTATFQPIDVYTPDAV